MTFFAPFAAMIAVAALVVGGVGHVVAPRQLASALRAQEFVPARFVPVVSVAVPVLELGIVLVAVSAAIMGATAVVAAAFGVAAVLFAGYAVYLNRLVASGRFAPCGCSMSDDPADVWSVVRAAVFAVTAVVAAVSPGLLVSRLDVPNLVVVAMAATTVTVLVWRLPAAMRQPTGGAPQWTS